jgi:hypothetical protein
VNAAVVEVDGFEVAVASLADIIRSKEIAHRPKDLEALHELCAIERRHWHRGARSEPPGLGFDL